MKLMIVAATLFASCATPSVPYLRHFPQPRVTMNWLVDGPPGGMLLTVYNPTDRPVEATVVCPYSEFQFGDGYGQWDTKVPPHGEARAITQVMNKDQFDEPCKLVAWWYLR